MADREQIQALLWNAWQQQAVVNVNMRIRRMLISRDPSVASQNATGIVLPHPFNETSLAIRTMLGEASKAVFTATSRITANQPEVTVVPLTTQGDSIGVTVDRQAGMQERADMQMLQECGIEDAHWQSSWAKSVGGAAFWLSLPRDADFGLPNRQYYDESDEEVAALRAAGKLAIGNATMPSGRLLYAEHGDVWAARRKVASKNRAVAGRSLFTLSVYPRDQVLKERDREARDLKWAAIIEEIPATDCAPGSPFAMDIARAKGMPYEDQSLFGVFWDTNKKQLIGGIVRGGPIESNVNAQTAYTLIRYFDREEQVILVSPRGSVVGAVELWRGQHGCRVLGAPACPVVEDPFYLTDVPTIGKEYATPLDPVFALIPQLNQLLTLESNVAVVNGIPRFVLELNDGANLRGDDGQPAQVKSEPTPGLDPSQIAAYPGQVKQLLIDDKSLLEALKVYFERLDLAMPTTGTDASGADAAAWALQMRIQEGQQPYKKAVENSCQALTGILQRQHAWLRQLDVPVYFFAAPGHRSNAREVRGLIEYDPKDLTDSIIVSQDLDTPSERTVRVQVGMEQWQAQLIDDEEYYREYAREQDPRDAVVRRWVQIVTNYVMTGALPPPPPGAEPGPAPIVQIVADGVRGQVHYALIQQSDNYALATAQGMAQQAQQMAAPVGVPGQPAAPGALGGQAMPSGQGNAAQAAGAVLPGMGMATSLQAQLGTGVPGGQQLTAPVGAQA